MSNIEKMKIAVFGTGYVGLSNSILLSQYHEVVAVDIVEEKVSMINEKKCPMADKDMSEYLENRNLNLVATTDAMTACKDVDFIIIATPTDYDESSHYFDTSSIETVLRVIQNSKTKAAIVIKSTVPVGYTQRLIAAGWKNIIFVPEFLREGRALYDNLYPSRIIIGGFGKSAKLFGQMMAAVCLKSDVPVIYMDPTEAEAVKLFSNTYLAMRVAFFNELDSYAMENNLDSKRIIEGVTLDPRIGFGYCNPSFGYGGYCLPKDTKQLLANYESIPQSLIRAIVESNAKRKEYILNKVLSCKPDKVGIYRLIMKSGSDNFRSSAILDIISHLKDRGVPVLIYEPRLGIENYMGVPVTDDIDLFTRSSSIILANRLTNQLQSVWDKVISRDIFGDN